MTNRTKVRLAGGLLLLLDFIALDVLPDLPGVPIGATANALVKFACWVGVSLCLLGGGLGVIGPTVGVWRDSLGVISIGVVLLGVTAYVVGGIYAFALLMGRYDGLLSQGFIAAGAKPAAKGFPLRPGAYTVNRVALQTTMAQRGAQTGSWNQLPQATAAPLMREEYGITV